MRLVFDAAPGRGIVVGMSTSATASGWSLNEIEVVDPTTTRFRSCPVARAVWKPAPTCDRPPRLADGRAARTTPCSARRVDAR